VTAKSEMSHFVVSLFLNGVPAGTPFSPSQKVKVKKSEIGFFFLKKEENVRLERRRRRTFRK